MICRYQILNLCCAEHLRQYYSTDLLKLIHNNGPWDYTGAQQVNVLGKTELADSQASMAPGTEPRVACKTLQEVPDGRDNSA